MSKLIRDFTLSVFGLGLLGAVGCTHKDAANEGASEVSVTDEARAEPRDRTVSTSEERTGQTQAAVRRTEAAAARTRAAVSGEAPREGSNEEYAADVDTAMGDRVATSDSESENTVAVNSDADNSRVNRVNNGDVGLTADQQGNSKSDIEITRKIRRSITSNDQLSTYAHNVKIITRDGRVVLKGPVRSEAERKIIEDTAVNVAGVTNVTSGLEIKAK